MVCSLALMGSIQEMANQDVVVVGLRFFRILLPGFSSKLRMPSALSKECRGKRAHLVGPNGKIWNVGIQREGESAYFGGTIWRELAVAHELGTGYFLVFRYRGNMTFTFRVFDLSTQEKNHCPSAKVATRSKASLKENDHPKRPPPPPPPPRRRNKRTLNEVESSSKAKKHCNTRPTCEVIIRTTNLSRAYMSIPIEFKRLSGISNEESEVRVRDPKGRTWRIGLVHRKKRTATMSAGWPAFAHSNELELGDRCTFQLLNGGKKNKVIQLSILKQ